MQWPWCEEVQNECTVGRQAGPNLGAPVPAISSMNSMFDGFPSLESIKHNW